MIMERNWSTLAINRRFVFGPGIDEPIVWYEGSGTTDRRWLHADERGSIIAVSNGSGAVTNINSYDEYGVPAAGNVGRFQYTGQAWLPELGMYYYKARIYNPGIGRFMQTDPIGYAAGMNLYGYVSGDPVNKTDPTGLAELLDDIVITGPVYCGFDCQSWNANDFFRYLQPISQLPLSPVGGIEMPEIVVTADYGKAKPQKEDPKPKGDLKQCLLGVGGKLLEGVLDPVGVVANGAAAVAVGAGYDVARYNATAGGVIVESGTRGCYGLVIQGDSSACE